MGFPKLKNPFKGRQPGIFNPVITPVPPPTQSYHPKVREALVILGGNPNASDTDLAAALHLTPEAAEPFIKRAREVLLAATLQTPSPQTGPTTGPLPGSGVKSVQHGSVTLVTFSPEELLGQVEQRRSGVSFDLSRTARFMDSFNQAWSWAGPILFALGTIGEIFLVLWQRQRVQDWFTGFTIIAVSMIAEGTLLAISFSAKRLRNRADKRSSGWTDKEKSKLKVLKYFWGALALGVAATQVAFVLAQTDPQGIGEGAVWAIAIIRSLAALVADCYTAFVSEEKPTSGELAIEQQDKETQFTRKLLEQQALEVEMLNTGAIRVQEVGIEAEAKQDLLNTQRELAKIRNETQKEVARLQNQAQIETLIADQEQKVLFDRMRNSVMQALFDPEMDPKYRQQILNTVTGLAAAMKKIAPPKPRTTVTEEDDE
jgi:hypothetical protein